MGPLHPTGGTTAHSPPTQRDQRSDQVHSGFQIQAIPPAAVIADTESPDGTARIQNLLSHRWLIEQGIAQPIRRGLLQARYVGKAKVQHQGIEASLVTNLVWRTDLMTGEPPSPVPRSPTQLLPLAPGVGYSALRP